ncbi:MAG: pilus assembly protein TadG-related protein [Chloroflexi bacterium]|nr:pilus assembly protein TadG-related protein [Chloroflexota bacterium]
MKHPRCYYESGHVALQIALSLMALVVFMGFALDLSNINGQRKQFQLLLDSSAQAGAQALCQGYDIEQAVTVTENTVVEAQPAPHFQASICGDQVTVTATVQITSYFSKYIGTPSLEVTSVALAACDNLPACVNYQNNGLSGSAE